MTTIVNTPAQNERTGSSGFLIGVILIIGLVMAFLYFGIPAIRSWGSAEINVPAPQVNIPDEIDVNVTQTQ